MGEDEVALRMRFIALLLLSGSFAFAAEDGQLEAIRALLVPLRGQTTYTDTRGATPVFTDIKHRLRDWVESRIAGSKENRYRWKKNPSQLEAELNDELSQARLLCGDQGQPDCPDESQLGFLGRVSLKESGDFLVARTSIGIQECGVDESAYIYSLRGGLWNRIFEQEQTDYTPDKYVPEWFSEILISPFDAGSPDGHLILTIGKHTWCSSNWRPLYYKVWELNASSGERRALLNEDAVAFLDAPTQGRVTRNDAYVKYSVDGLEGGSRDPELRHYVLENGKLRREDPVAVSPKDFASFWLRNDFKDVARWTEQASRSRIAAWRNEHKAHFEEFGFPSKRCTKHPGVWQLSTGYGDYPNETQVYFLVRWRPPYHFTMESASGFPLADCTEEDPDADELILLFAPQ
jgi:hypothetical protein